MSDDPVVFEYHLAEDPSRYSAFAFDDSPIYTTFHWVGAVILAMHDHDPDDEDDAHRQRRTRFVTTLRPLSF